MIKNKYELAVYETWQGTKVGLFKDDNLDSVLFLYNDPSFPSWFHYDDNEFVSLNKEELRMALGRYSNSFNIIDSWVE